MPGTGFAEDQINQGNPRYSLLYIGQVVARDDPKNLGRVKVRVPGFLEPSSPWALPLTMGTGAASGLFMVPALGAQVAVFFAFGRVERPYYLAANWYAGQQAPEATSPDVRLLCTENFSLELNEELQRLRVNNRRTGDVLELNLAENSITIRGTTAITIECTGLIDIRGAAVQIQGRPVLPVPDPI